MIKAQLDELPKSTIFVCKRCKTLYWNILTRSELYIKKDEVVECQYCKRTNIFCYDSKEKLIEDINQNILGLQRTKRRSYEKDIEDLNNLKEELKR